MCNTAMNYVDLCPCSPSIGDGEVNYFVEMSSDSETEQPHYMDFFDPPSCEGEEEEEEEIEEEEEEEIEEEDEDKEEKEENMAMRKEESDFSTHERRQQKVGVTHDSALVVESVPPLNLPLPPPPPPPQLQHTIASLEAANLADKPWQMSGEVSAKSRPVNRWAECEMDAYNEGQYRHYFSLP